MMNRIQLTAEAEQFARNIYNETPQKVKEIADNKAGIYGIFVDEHLVYIGKSTSLLWRWCCHKAHTLCPQSLEYNRPIYQQLRWAYQNNHHVTINLLENIDDRQELNQKEDEYIAKYMPALNKKLPGGRWKNITPLHTFLTN